MRVVAREQAEVGVEARGAGVVVAGRDVRVAAEAVVVVAHDERDLRVRLEPDDAVRDVDAGALHARRPLDVRFLVEPRLELEHDRDLLAVLRGAHEVLDDVASPSTCGTASS